MANAKKSKKSLPPRVGAKKRLPARTKRFLGHKAAAKKGGSTRREGDFEAVMVKVKPTFGFAATPQGERDWFVPGGGLNDALPGDAVLLRPEKRNGPPRAVPQGVEPLEAARVVRILARAAHRVSGTVQKSESGALLLVPDSNAYPALPMAQKPAQLPKPGEKAVATLYTGEQPQYQNGNYWQVLCGFGSAEKAENCAAAIVEAAGLPTAFDPALLAEADRVAAQPIAQEIAKRRDLRGEDIFTIDGADTRDIDDAISLQQTETGWLLGVHIADVSHYVQPASPLDREALQRGTSVYLPSAVLPMLPPALSNGACSLNPNEDRLAFSALIALDADGVIRDFTFAKTVIRSRVKGVYSEVNALFSGEASPEIQKKYSAVLTQLQQLRMLSAVLGRRRRTMGSIALSSVESKVLIDAQGVTQEICPRTQGEAEALIEQMMLTANEAAATLALQKQLPFVFRIHEPPAPEKLTRLRELLEAVGLPHTAVAPGVTPAALSQILAQARQTPFDCIVNTTMLRTMQKARYEPKNLGHYGLALQNYAHFTSPIRRYPDLAIHRILSAWLAGENATACHRRFDAFVNEAARQSSETELLAMQTERACEDCYKAEYMKRHLGEVFTGTVSSAAPHGLYVQLDNTVEGLLRADSLGEGMLYDGRMQYATADGTRRVRVGDRITVLVAAAEVPTGKIDFDLAP